MTCQICGVQSTNGAVQSRPSKKQVLCSRCNADTPRKATRQWFDAMYWGAKFEEVSPSTRRDFYSDYLSSTHTLPEYIEATTSICA